MPLAGSGGVSSWSLRWQPHVGGTVVEVIESGEEGGAAIAAQIHLPCVVNELGGDGYSHSHLPPFSPLWAQYIVVAKRAVQLSQRRFSFGGPSVSSGVTHLGTAPLLSWELGTISMPFPCRSRAW